MTKRVLGAVLVLASTLGLAVSGAAAAAPTPTPKPITVPGGLAAGATHALAGDCELGNVTCRPGLSGSCSSTVTTTTPPSATTPIKVLVRTANTNTVTITSVPFQTYVQNVLPNEWVPTWDGDARKAGAVAVKTYAWYWMSHFGGYLNDDPTQCFDVTDDPDFQKYKANSALAATNSSIAQTWPVFGRKDNQVFQTQYRDTLTGSTAETCGAGVNGTQLSQYGSQNCNDPDLRHGGNTANKYNVILQLYYGSDLQLATTAQLRSQHDFQYLHHSTPATFTNGTWSIGDGYPTVVHFGAKGDAPFVNTVGDGFARVGVYRSSNHTWFLGTPTGQIRSSLAFGATGDVRVPAQYNGLSAPTQIAVWRPSNGTWYFATSTGHIASTVSWGAKGDVPVPGRWLSATADSVAVFRPSTGRWYVRGLGTYTFGTKGDIPVPADYNGDGRTERAVYRPSNHTFYLPGQTGVPWGTTGDVPVTGDVNGDGKADLAVYRPSNHTFYVRGVETLQVGTSAATAIGAAPYRD